MYISGPVPSYSHGLNLVALSL
jgi:hypothetical protein